MATSEKLFRDSRVQVGVLLLILLLTYFTNLGAADVGLMEARNFVTAREMAESGNWLIPTLNGEIRLAKPPLPTWITALSGMAAGDMHNVAALRFPAAVMACLMILFLFLLVRELVTDKLIPFLAAVVMAGSVAVFNAGHQGTWDIYCHSFMLGAIWLMVKGLRDRGANYGIFALSGLLLGCSFLSKGPVAFYAMLLPFLISYGYGSGWKSYKYKWAGMALAFSISMAVSIPWPLYISLVEPTALAGNVENESTAWINRHVQPLWYYWGFVAQAGVWTLFAAAALAGKYARKRTGQYANYTFLFLWVIITILLLSVIPEKKERYLLPVLAPLAVLIACYLRYLFESIGQGVKDKWGKWAMLVTTGALVVASCALPVLAYFFAFRTDHISAAQLMGISAVSLFLGLAVFRSAQKRLGLSFFLSAALLNSFVLALAAPIYQDGLHKEEDYKTLEDIRDAKELRGLPLFSVGDMSPVQVWEVGRRVQIVQVEGNSLHLPTPAVLPAAVFSRDVLKQAYCPDSTCSLKEIGSYQLSKENPEEVYHVYLVEPERHQL